MKRQVPGLAETTRDSRPEIPDGIFLVRLEIGRASCRERV